MRSKLPHGNRNTPTLRLPNAILMELTVMYCIISVKYVKSMSPVNKNQYNKTLLIVINDKKNKNDIKNAVFLRILKT